MLILNILTVVRREHKESYIKKDTTLHCALSLESFDYSSFSSILEIFIKLMILRIILAIIRITTV